MKGMEHSSQTVISVKDTVTWYVTISKVSPSTYLTINFKPLPDELPS